MTWAEYFKENSDKMPKEFLSKEITVEDCLKIIDGMAFSIKELFEKIKWHTGTPTENTYEDGKATLYLVTDKTGNYYDVARWNCWNDGHWSVGWFEVFAWQKIEPYKGE